MTTDSDEICVRQTVTRSVKGMLQRGGQPQLFASSADLCSVLTMWVCVACVRARSQDAAGDKQFCGFSRPRLRTV